MQTDRIAQPIPLARDDTLLGVCQSLGEDFGFNPFYLRLALGIALIWNPVLVIGSYLAAALVVTPLRLIVRDPAFAEASAGEPASVVAAPEGDNDEEALAAAA